MAYLYDLIETRKKEKRDLKIIITARNSQTGTGKTTLAVKLAKMMDKKWNADKCCFDLQQYSKMYENLTNGSCILLDEAELAADSRRSMSKNNVTLSQQWSTLRYRQVSTIATLPTVSMLDKRLIELADVRIIVLKRGVASVRQITIDDLTGRIYQQHMEKIYWDTLDGDVDYERMCDMKHKHTMQIFKAHGMTKEDPAKKIKELQNKIKQIEREKEVALEKQKKEFSKELKQTIINREVEILKSFSGELSQRKLAELLGVSVSTINARVNSDNHVTDKLLNIRSLDEIPA